VITIRPIRPEDVPAARRLILSVAYDLFGWDGTLEESIAHFESSGELADMDDIQAHYFDAGGLFLVALDGPRLVGTGAVRRLDPLTAELKRMWLPESYQGRGIGYQLMQRLLRYARDQGYERIRLQTSPQQTRALAFYRRVGFREIPAYSDAPGEISMELSLPVPRGRSGGTNSGAASSLEEKESQ
jgi:GNAT superfamily N-acetyltransferase